MMADSDKIIDGFAYWIENEEKGVCYIPLDLCEKVLKLLKSQKEDISNLKKQVPKTGHWVGQHMGYCSNCMHDIPSFLSGSEWKEDKTPYCPSCGAVMTVEDEDGRTEE